MGLSEGKRKQRLIGSASTRNTNWANDASLPGQKLLSSMGWSAGQGLGSTTNQGSTSHVPVAYKMDNKGIGAQRREKEERKNGKLDTWSGAGGDLGGLFERLNRQAEEQRQKDGDGGVKSESEDEEEEKPKKKRKRDGKEKEKNVGTKEERKAARKLEKEAAKIQKKEAKKARKLEKGKAVEEVLVKEGKDPKDKKEKKKVLEKKAEKVEGIVNARMASRAKFLRAKRMVGTDALSVNEILGISAASSAAASAVTSPIPSGSSTPTLLSEPSSKKRKRDKDSKTSKSKSKSSKSNSESSSSDSSSSEDEESGENEKSGKLPIQSFSDPNKLQLSTKSLDPSLAASPLNPVSQLSVQAYLSQRLMVKKAAIEKRKREHDEGVWGRVSQSVKAL